MKTFQIEGPLQAYVRTTQRQKWVDPRYKRYLGWKGLVRLLATTAGIPDDLPQDCRATVSCSVMWIRNARFDGDNFLKGILDALWAQDRRVQEIHYIAFEGTGAEKASVTVAIEMGTRGETDGKRRKVREQSA